MTTPSAIVRRGAKAHHAHAQVLCPARPDGRVPVRAAEQRNVDHLQPATGRGIGHGRRLHSEQLLGPAQEVEIAHGDAVYRLRRTSLGKLILTK